MKKDSIAIIVLVTVLLVAFAIGLVWFFADDAKEPVPVEQNATSTVSEEIPIAEMVTEKGSDTFYNYTLTYPKSSPQSLSEIYQFVEDQKKEFKTTYGDISGEEAQAYGAFEGNEFTLTIATKVTTSSDTASYILTVYTYTGGAHGGTITKTFTYNAKGELLTLTDVLKGSDIYRKLSERARSYFYKKLPDTTRAEIDTGTEPNAETFSNWYVRGDDIVFIFDEYSIGPYALGTQEFVLPKGRVTAL